MKIGLQLYTLREYLCTQKTFLETIDEVADLGYQGVEIAGVGCLERDVTLEQAATWIQFTGMTITGAHRDWSGLHTQTDREIAYLKELHTSYVAVPDPPQGFEHGGLSTYQQWLIQAKPVPTG